MGWQALKVFKGVEIVLVVVSPHHEHGLIWSNEFDRPTGKKKMDKLSGIQVDVGMGRQQQIVIHLEVRQSEDAFTCFSAGARRENGRSAPRYLSGSTRQCRLTMCQRTNHTQKLAPGFNESFVS